MFATSFSRGGRAGGWIRRIFIIMVGDRKDCPSKMREEAVAFLRGSISKGRGDPRERMTVPVVVKELEMHSCDANRELGEGRQGILRSLDEIERRHLRSKEQRDRTKEIRKRSQRQR